MRRRTAYRTKSKKLVKKVKSFLIYSFLSIVLVLFISQIFLSNILEYSFSLAKSGVGKDFKNADKYNLLLINKNSLNEVLDTTLIVFDKNNEKLFSYEIDVHEENFYMDKKVNSIKFLYKDTEFNQEGFVKYFEKNYGILINHSMVFGGSEYEIYRKTIEGDLKINELGEVLSIKNIGIRNTFLMYSYSKDLTVENKKTLKVNSIFELDKQLKDIYIDSEVAEEKLSISVVNASGINGIGKRVSRYVSNTGGRVVDLTTKNTNEEKSIILYKEDSKTLGYLSNILNINNTIKVEDDSSKIQSYPELIKSDIVIILGLDISEDLR
jgi:hypothetical protein